MYMEKKADKYKLKYLALKKQLGGFVPEPEFMTSRIDPKSNFYLSQNLFSYWISSSHNTYLPFNQNTNNVSLCYYNLQSMVYAGGCLEIDTYGIKDNDVIITHLSEMIQGSIKLSDILDIIMDALNKKIEHRIKSGPFILTFDNKGLDKKSDQNIFWNIINNKLLSGPKVDEYKRLLPNDPIPVQVIEKDFDLLNIPIEKMSNKILFRWGLNKKCQGKDKDVGHELCPPDEAIIIKFSKNDQKWIHLEKSKMEIMNKFIDCKDLPEGEYCTNMSKSSASPLMSNLTPVNLRSIVNTQRLLMRFYPHSLNLLSGNYNNMKYFRDGVQITAINLQKIGEARLLNDAVFIPPTSEYCSPEQIIENKCTDRHDFQAYRLKPLWLLGLVPYPQLYNLIITISDPASKIIASDPNFKIIYGLNKQEYKPLLVNNEYVIQILDIDVTVPFFVIENSEFKNGIEIVWSQTILSENLNFNLYKFDKSDKSPYNNVNTTNNCQKDRLLNYSEIKKCKLQYVWTPATSSSSKDNTKHMELVTPYNDAIIQARTTFELKTTSELLQNLGKLNEYQQLLFNIMNKKNITVQPTEQEDGIN